MLVYAYICLLSTLFSPSLQETHVVLGNILVDFLVSMGKRDLSPIGKLPNKMETLLLDTTLDLENGVIHGLKSVSRVGNVTFAAGNSTVGAVDLQFGNLKIDFRNYTLSIGPLKLSAGKIFTSPVNVKARVHVKFGTDICNISLEHVDLHCFPGFDVSVTPDSKWGSISALFLNKILHVFNSFIKDVVKKEIDVQLKIMVNSYHRVCKQLYTRQPSQKTHKQDVVKPDVGKQDVGKQDVGKQDVGKPDVGKQDVGKQDVGKQDVGKQDVGKQDVGKPDVIKPDVVKPDVVKQDGDKQDGDKQDGDKQDGDKHAVVITQEVS